MKIQNLSFRALPLAQTKPANSANTDYKNNYSYNPIGYRDFNINFTARLFRTPENFFAQPFNKNGMPDTMKEYLNADFEDRQKMPPAQMLRLVFDDIKETKNLEQVKRIFPDEPLFKKLTDTPNRKARTGIIAEIDLMREEGKTLFKNGNDNLGHYILKKIYTESKTLKEINTDFKKDVSVHYKGLSPIGYDTLQAYGIKFPDNGFWKSLTATREEFPYEYKPRKPIESRISTSHNQQPKVYTPVRKRFEDIKDWEIDKIKKALIDGNGSKTETGKYLKKTNIRDEASLNFVAKYLGEINSVVLEKLNISPEMRYFFENYEQLNKSQTQKFTEYMQKKDVNELRSIVMTDTIKLFFDAYGVDGQNEEFQELLAYARNIKPEREKALREHDRIQAEYDEMFANIPEENSIQTVQKSEDVNAEQVKPYSFEEQLKKVSKENNADLYTFELGNGYKISVSINLEEAVNKKIKREFLFYPQKFIDEFSKYLLKKEGANTKYLLSLACDPNELGNTTLSTVILDVDKKNAICELFKKECLLANDEIIDKSCNILNEYINKHEKEEMAIHEALAAEVGGLKINSKHIDKIINNGIAKEKAVNGDFTDDDELLNNIHKRVDEINKKTSSYSILWKQTKTLNEVLKFYIPEEEKDEVKARITQRFQLYRQPLSKQEIRELPAKIVDAFPYYDINKSILGDVQNKYIIKAICDSAQQDKNFRNMIINKIKTLSSVNSSLAGYKMFFDENKPKDLLGAKIEFIIGKLLQARNPSSIIMSLTDKSVENIKYNSPELYLLIKKFKDKE